MKDEKIKRLPNMAPNCRFVMVRITSELMENQSHRVKKFYGYSIAVRLKDRLLILAYVPPILLN